MPFAFFALPNFATFSTGAMEQVLFFRLIEEGMGHGGILGIRPGSRKGGQSENMRL